VLQLAQTLIRHGYKVTEPRLEIIEAVTTFENGFTLNELLERLNERAQEKGNPPPGVASAFRTVKLMTEELELLQRVHSGDGCHRYTLQRGHQHQIICRCCERTVEFEGCDFEELTQFLEEKTGFSLEGHWLEFFGLCHHCRIAQPGGQNEGVKASSLLPHEHPHETKERSEPVNVSPVLKGLI
jgi:Fe2+ or Zn2+ uptake regulation protein